MQKAHVIACRRWTNISRGSSGMVSRGMLICNVTGSKCDEQHKPCMTSDESFDIATTLNESHFSDWWCRNVSVINYRWPPEQTTNDHHLFTLFRNTGSYIQSHRKGVLWKLLAFNVANSFSSERRCRRHFPKPMSVVDVSLDSWLKSSATTHQYEFQDWGRQWIYPLIIEIFIWSICLALYRGMWCSRTSFTFSWNWLGEFSDIAFTFEDSRPKVGWWEDSIHGRHEIKSCEDIATNAA